MIPAQRLTLGALYREMRAGLGDAGRVRVMVEFQQHTMPATGEGEPVDRPRAASLIFESVVDYEDRVLDRAEMALRGAAVRGRLVVRRHGDGYAYSVDGGTRWGRFVARPLIFDLVEFESELGHVAVEDATFEVVGDGGDHSSAPAPEREATTPPREQSVDALDVSLERSAFLRLLRIFSADVGDDPDASSLSAYSVSLEAAETVSLLYWWSLTERVDEPGAEMPLRVRCSVSIRVAAVEGPEPAEASLDGSLPDVADLDGVWAVLRSHAGAGGAGPASEWVGEGPGAGEEVEVPAPTEDPGIGSRSGAADPRPA